MANYDVLLVIFIGLFGSLLSEGLTWYLVYRKESYKRLKTSIDKLTDQIDNLKSQSVPVNKQKQHDKKLSGFEEQLKQCNNQMNNSKLKSTFAVALCMIAIFYNMNNYYYGKTVAKLPFTPISFIQGLTHRGIDNEDYTLAGATFIYVLTGM